MLTVILALAAAASAWFAYAKPFTRDGTSFRKAIVLHDKGAGQTREEWAVIGKLYPDATLFPYRHSTMVHDGRCFSYYSVATPHGQKDIYFDTGDPCE
jgi:hypothetical protein